MRCCATCRGHRSRRWHRSRIPANGAAPRGGRRLKAEALGSAGRDGFAGDAVNPSVEAWPRHPCRGHPRKPIPPGHGQFPCASTTEKKEKIKSGSGSLRCARSEPSMARLYRTSVIGKLSGVGRCGAAGPLAPWMAPSSPQGGVYGVSCSPTPPRPTLSNPEPLWLWLWRWPLQVQGCKPCQNTYVTQPAITSNARIASHSSSIRHTRLIASRRSGSRCHTGNSPASV